MVIGPDRQRVADDAVLHRAVLDHTALCDACGRTGPCLYLRRLQELVRIAGEADGAPLRTVDSVLGREGTEAVD
ncbi:hypothetical protein GCM10010433_74480 [Streptomyces pulveraceus]